MRAFSDRTGAPIVTHISETKREVDDSVKAKGASPVAYLERIGFLNERVIAAHMVWPQGSDIAILKRRRRWRGSQSAVEYEARVQASRLFRRC